MDNVISIANFSSIKVVDLVISNKYFTICIVHQKAVA